MPDKSNPAAGERRPGVDLIIEPRRLDLGGFTVGRVLPYAHRKMVGPFIFFDEVGPARFPPGKGIDVRPHPHIGLATVTFLFNGEIRHKDSLQSDQIIKPGDVNWMTAGRGIVHSERTDEKLRAAGHNLHGIQSWVALPVSEEETAPSFHHHPKQSLPLINRPGLELHLIAGSAFGETSPVKTFSPMFYLAASAEAGASIELPANYDERALYILDGGILVNGRRIAPKKMVVFEVRERPEIVAEEKSRIILLGGASIGSRIIWWNLVSHSQAQIDAARQEWIDAASDGFRSGRFQLPPEESEHIPAPSL